MKITAKLIAESDPRSPHQWRFSPEATKKLAEDMVGHPVTVNFDPEHVVGQVTDAEHLGDQTVTVTMEVEPDSPILGASEVELGPGFVSRESDDGDVVRKAELFAVSVINAPPVPKGGKS